MTNTWNITIAVYLLIVAILMIKDILFLMKMNKMDRDIEKIRLVFRGNTATL